MNTFTLFAALLVTLSFTLPVQAQFTIVQPKRLVVPDTLQNVQLADAVERLDLSAVQNALQNGASADAFVGWEGQSQQTPVAIEAARILPDERQKALPVFRLLVAHVSNPNAADALGITLLTTAAGLSDLPSVTHLVEAGANVNARQTQAPAGATALHAALMPSANEKVQDPSPVALFLLEHGADVNAADERGTTPLMLAAQFGRMETVRLLLARGADPALRDTGGRTALGWAAMSRNGEKIVALLRKVSPMTLHEAAQFGDAARVRAHLDAGENANAADVRGVTPLMDAAKSGSVEVARLLLDRGADVNHKLPDGSTALHSAALYGDVGLVGLLLDRGADMNAVRGVKPPFATPLSLAVEQAQADVVALLLKRGASIQNGRGAAALDSAIQNAGVVFVRRPRLAPKAHTPSEDAVLDARWCIINSLLEAGVDVRAKDSHALYVAAREGQLGIMELLLKKGADINGRGAVGPNEGVDDGATVLMGAIDAWIGARTDEEMVRDGSLMGPDLKDVLENQKIGRQCVEMALARGANVNRPDARGTTPLMQCVSSDLPALTDLLLAHGVKINAADLVGRTALMRAAAENDRAMASWLLAHHASVNKRDKQGRTALMLAVDDGTNDSIKEGDAMMHLPPTLPRNLPNPDGHPDMVRLLLRHGASVRAAAQNGATALSLARKQGFVKVVSLLTQAKASQP